MTTFAPILARLYAVLLPIPECGGTRCARNNKVSESDLVRGKLTTPTTGHMTNVVFASRCRPGIYRCDEFMNSGEQRQNFSLTTQLLCRQRSETLPRVKNRLTTIGRRYLLTCIRSCNDHDPPRKILLCCQEVHSRWAHLSCAEHAEGGFCCYRPHGSERDSHRTENKVRQRHG